MTKEEKEALLKDSNSTILLKAFEEMNEKQTLLSKQLESTIALNKALLDSKNDSSNESRKNKEEEFKEESEKKLKEFMYDQTIKNE